MILGTGIDLIEVERIRSSFQKFGERFALRILVGAEMEYCLSHRDPAPFIAARFAAKEAALKALQTGWRGGISWQDVEVSARESGAPYLIFTGQVLEVFKNFRATATHLSISHTSENAIAQVVLER